jgi:pilus assembly protein Flp/PilA
MEQQGVEWMSLRLYTAVTTWWTDLMERADDDRGATAIEYALMVALIAMVIIVAVTLLGATTSAKFDEVGSGVANVGS